MSVAALTSYSNSTWRPTRRQSKVSFKNTRVLQKLRGDRSSECLSALPKDDMNRVMKTQPDEPTEKAERLPPRASVEFDQRSEFSARSAASLTSFRSSMSPLKGIQKNNSELANITQRSFMPEGEQDLSKLTLPELQKKLDLLLDQKLQLLLGKGHKMLKLKKANDFERLRTKAREQRIAREFSRLLQMIRIRKNAVGGDRDPSFARWKTLDAKIALLEKALAENTTELEIMKGYFAMFAHRRTQYKALCRSRHNKLQPLVTLVDKINPSILDNLKASNNIQVKLPVTSVNKVSYNAPAEGDYEKYRFKHTPYKHMQRPVPPSNYQQSYRKYPIFRQSSQPSSQSNLNKLGWSPLQKDSSYRENYTGRPSIPINFRELDCFKDKFKQMPVKFYPQTTAINPEDVAELRQMQKQFKPKNTDRFKSEPSLPLESTSRLFLKRVSDADRRVFQTAPKNQRLVRFKQSFKLQVKQ